MANASLQEIIACIGFPIAGNPTQFVMERAFRAAGFDSRCLTVDVAPEHLAAAIGGMRAMGFRGGVVEPPHQRAAGALLERVTGPAGQLGEVDLIYRDEDGQLVGESSLLCGVTENLARHTDLAGKRTVVLGAGAVARAAALAVGLADAERITIVARNDAAGDHVAQLLRPHIQSEIDLQTWASLYCVHADVDIVIQATSCSGLDAGHPLRLDLESLKPSMLLLDAVYNPPQTAFAVHGQTIGCDVINGLDLLVQRAVVAFRMWTELEPDLAVVREAFEEFFLI